MPEREPSKTLEREIRTFCNSRLAEYKWVRTVEFVAAMPKTISGKIRKPNSEPEGASGRPIHQAGGTEDGRAAKRQASQHPGRAHQGRGGGDQPLRGGRVFHAADRPAVRGVLRRAL
ncbi:MAG: AMP-binding enzyme [Evtepia gabavorous]